MAVDSSNEDLSKGMIVRLKAGGPDMTVNGISGTTGQVHCVWFAGKKLEQGYFAPETLVLVEHDTTKPTS